MAAIETINEMTLINHAHCAIDIGCSLRRKRQRFTAYDIKFNGEIAAPQ